MEDYGRRIPNPKVVYLKPSVFINLMSCTIIECYSETVFFFFVLTRLLVVRTDSGLHLSITTSQGALFTKSCSCLV